MVTNADRLAQRKARMQQSLAILRGGFRPFFLSAAVWAIVTLIIWLAILFGYLPSDVLRDPFAWHRHEMLFGFAGAAMAGFALTAVPNWTGKLPIAGRPLLFLFAFWAAARVAPFAGQIGSHVAPFIDGAFYLVLAIILCREVARSSKRNVPVAAGIGLFGIFAAIDGSAQAEWIVTDMGWRGGYAVVIMMIALIGGRIIPSFTHNWLAKNGRSEKLPAQPGRYDIILLICTGIALVEFLIAPRSPAGGWLLLAMGVSHAVRLIRWQGWRAARDPLVLVLHVGYAWLPVGLVLLGLAGLETVPYVAAFHALGAGAMATMILAVMTRATLGHTGRALHADWLTTAIFLLVTVAALARVAAGFAIGDQTVLLALAGAGWVGAFGLFCFAYGPKLWSPRIDGKP